MKLFLITLLILLVGWHSAFAQQGQDSSAAQEREIFTVVEQPPSFPGGMHRLDKYLRQNMRYPEAAQNANIRGRVFVNFLVTDQGRIEEVRVLKSVDPELDAEAVRLIQAMPAWTPGKQAGRPVNVRFNLPVNFHR